MRQYIKWSVYFNIYIIAVVNSNVTFKGIWHKHNVIKYNARVKYFFINIHSLA